MCESDSGPSRERDEPAFVNLSSALYQNFTLKFALTDWSDISEPN